MEGRALINDPMDHFSEGACLQRWLLPDASTGQGPDTLARKLSRCRIYIAYRCALCPPKRSEGGCPGAYTIPKLSWEQEQKLRSFATKSRHGGTKTVTTCPAFLEKAGNNLPILSVL